MPAPNPNHDENLVSKEFVNSHEMDLPQEAAPYIGNYHKTLPHNHFGEVCPAAYMQFKETCLSIEDGAPLSFEGIATGTRFPAFASGADPDATVNVAAFTSPLAGAAREEHGPSPKDLEMPPAPGIRSASTAAEMTELYWMALLRDVPLLAFQPSSASTTNDLPVEQADRELVDKASKELGHIFDRALKADATLNGGLRLRQDLPFEADTRSAGCACGERLDIQQRTLFRSGLHDEEYGPIVSQFFLHEIPYGTQTINQRQVPYIMGKDFLTSHEDWLRAQNTGKDRFGRSYGVCNFYGDQLAKRETYYPNDVNRYISTMRDLARFVNRDALHQAYFNAALFLADIGTPPDAGNPYAGNLYTREAGFATLGGPDLLTLVSEVASRSLKVVWRQKWFVHRRCRPEAYGGLAQMQFNGYDSRKRNYRLPEWIAETEAAKRIQSHNAKLNGVDVGTLFLPMAFSAGSPTHPAYGAGHATVAGACVTVLKAWFDEDASLKSILDKAMADNRRINPTKLKGLLQPGNRKSGENFSEPQAYCGPDVSQMTVGGELNKIASNVAMGRSMGGVHWRTDNTRSLRLGESIAIEILRKRTLEYAERPVSFTFRAFDRHMVRITEGQVQEY